MKVFLLFSILYLVKSQCPHMGGKRPSSPSPPSPPHTSIQSTFVFRSHNEEDSLYSQLVSEVLQRVKRQLRDKANISLDNDNVECNDESNQPPCTDYEGMDKGYHLFILEDQRQGAVVYSIDRDMNGMDERKIEAAILDCVSRHSRRDLTSFSSPQTEKIVGFVRELSNEQLEEMGKKKKERKGRKGGEKGGGILISPLLINTLDKKILQMRSAEGYDKIDHLLIEVKNEEEMDNLLNEKTHLFILFWSSTDLISLHSFALWANTSKSIQYEDSTFAHVPCHIYHSFCNGLQSRDLHQIVGFTNGMKVSTLSEMNDYEMYKDWIEIVRKGPVRELINAEEVKEVKKGYIDGKRRIAVTIGTFPSRDDIAFRHYQMAADKLFGQYYLFYRMKEGLSTIQTYRYGEKMKRQSHLDEFDPYSIAQFIVSSSEPSIIDISNGLSSEGLLRSSRPLILLISSSSFHSSSLSSFSTKHSSSYIVAYLDSSRPESESVLKDVLISNREEPQLILFDKTKVWHMEIEESNTEDEIYQWTTSIVNTEPDLVLSPLSIHPLRILQISHINRIFGIQKIDPPEDPSIYTPLPSYYDSLSSLRHSQSSSGCPFMKDHSTNNHDEL